MTIKRIMMPIDVGVQPRTVGRIVASLARRLDADVLLFHAMTPDLEKYGEPFLFANRSRLETHAQAVATDAFEEIQLSRPFEGLRTTTKFMKATHAASAVVEWARRLDADLIVVPNFVRVRERMRKVFLGSVTERIVQEASTPVMICPVSADESSADDDVDFKLIVAPTDLSDAAHSAFSSAVDIARAFGSHVDLLHVIEQKVPLAFQLYNVHSSQDLNPHFRERVTEHLESVAAEQFPDVECSVHFRIGKASAAIPQFVEHNHADLVVMATEGQDSIGDVMLGSTTERVVRASCAPILIEPYLRRAALADSA